ncbi:cation:proton antiporter [Wolbachia pipientis]|uniref:Cation:proton antiporter n=1 Tax=Wolbachia pipientis TaxID=955 RepID=A0A1E7QJJ1_WOLPI|nr:DUF4040 domain-containing protein [Wolbachia pipientis]OEY86638.1 cation:proton antiporter [Wolbachia pipientis]
MFEILNLVLLSLLFIVALSIAFSKNLVNIAILMCTFSSLMAVIYLNMNAPDVAITEASVGAGLSTIFTFAALSLIKNHKTNSSHSFTIFCLMLIFATFLSYFIYKLPEFGNYGAPIHHHVAPYYINNTAIVAGIPNIVTVILASFRGYDTFVETIVIFTAALCTSLILKGERDD